MPYSQYETNEEQREHLLSRKWLTVKKETA
jgi:hypothetical protein